MQDARNLRVMVVYGWESNPYAESTIRALLKRGVKVDFVAREGAAWPGNEPNCTVYPIFPGHRRTRSPLRMLFLEAIALARVLRLVLKTRPDIIHYQSFRMIRLDWVLFLVLQVLGAKIAFTVHDTHSLEASAVDTFIFSRTARRSDVLLVHNSNSRNVLIQTWKVRTGKVRIVPHGGYDCYYSRALSKSTARSRLGYQDELVLLAFGTIREYKGLDYLLPAVAEARHTVPPLRLIVAGRSFNAALGTRYRQQISELGLDDIVRFENRFIETAEVETLFAAADLVVLPYIRIDQSGVLFLAYTFGRPVLASSIGGLPELVREGVSGYLVRPGDTRALSDGIVKASAERDRLEDLGSNARKLVEEEYTWERQADITLDAYASLLGGRPRPAAVDRGPVVDAARHAAGGADRSHHSSVP